MFCVLRLTVSKTYKNNMYTLQFMIQNASYTQRKKKKLQHNALCCDGKRIMQSNGINHFQIQHRCAFIILSTPEVLIQENRGHLERHMVSLIPKSSP